MMQHTGQGRTASPLFSAALQNRLTAALCHCKYTYIDLLFIQCAMMQHQCTAALVRAEQLPHCSVLLCKTGSQQPCATANTPMEMCSSYRCAMMQTQMHCSTGQGRTASHCSVLLCKTGSQQPCATAITPMEICSSYRCAMMQHKCTAALVKAEQLPHCSVLLCKTGSQQPCATANTPVMQHGDLVHTGVQ